MFDDKIPNQKRSKKLSVNETSSSSGRSPIYREKPKTPVRAFPSPVNSRIPNPVSPKKVSFPQPLEIKTESEKSKTVRKISLDVMDPRQSLLMVKSPVKIEAVEKSEQVSKLEKEETSGMAAIIEAMEVTQKDTRENPDRWFCNRAAPYDKEKDKLLHEGKTNVDCFEEEMMDKSNNFSSLPPKLRGKMSKLSKFKMQKFYNRLFEKV